MASEACESFPWGTPVAIEGPNATNVTVCWPNGFEVAYFDTPAQARCSQSFINIPGINLLPASARAVLYALALAYVFMGIAIIADIFMSAVEQICSQEKTVVTADGTTITAQVWNATVANITLMALGSSAPEILLAIVETVLSLGDVPGELGPSTIVGSAAFNLLMITAVCIVALPASSIKSISDIYVFATTAAWSIAVYVWMYVVLDIWTPGVVTVLESWITLGAMAAFVLHAYLQDRKWFLGKPAARGSEAGSDEPSQSLNHGSSPEDEQAEIIGITIKDKDGQTYGNNDRKSIRAIMKMLKAPSKTAVQLRSAFSFVTSHVGGESVKRTQGSSIFWKVNARHRMAGRKHLATREETMRSQEQRHGGTPRTGTPSKTPEETPSLRTASHNVSGRGGSEPSRSMSRHRHNASVVPDVLESRVMFTTHDYRVVESAGVVRIAVRRIADDLALGVPTAVDFETHDGTALAPRDYKACKGTMVFEEGEVIKYLEVPIYDNDEPNVDKTFNIVLTNHREHAPDDQTPTLGSIGRVNFRLGAVSLAQVLIIDDDHPGTFSFEENSVTVLETCGTMSLKVVRTGGCAGTVSVDYYTSDGSAEDGKHYHSTSGTLTFGPKQTEEEITVSIIDTDEIGPDTVFHVILYNATNHATVGRQNVAMIHIRGDDGLDEMASNLRTMLLRHREAFQHATFSWRQNLLDALTPQPGVDDHGEELELGFSDFLMHYLTVFWKVLFCIVPPTSYCGGWVTFVVSLIMIGVVTVVVRELAELFGCAIGLKDSITAISFVALGTSLPDLFASRNAAQEADDADAAIGNVTGSNSVNVLLGLGIPWVIGSMYYKYVNPSMTGGLYCVPSGTLAYSVMVFSICAAACIAVLLLRRRFVGGELGGPALSKWTSSVFLACLWVLYLVLSALQSYGYIQFGSVAETDLYGCRI